MGLELGVIQDHLQVHLAAIYGAQAGQETFARLQALLESYAGRLAAQPVDPAQRMQRLSQRDAILITYGDQVSEPGVPPLATLAAFCERHLAGLVSGLHLLPFYPYSSDDGFSVIDYRQVDPALGTWRDISRLGESFRLMFDAVINHISTHSAWFQAFLKDDPHYRPYFITIEGHPDLSQVVRPRALPLLTTFETPSGPKAVWTTFSTDQVDLNYQHPALLLEVIDTLLFYVAQGAEFIRLDAIAYLWKEPGTSCIHLPQTHRIIQLLRSVLDAVAPQVFLITETNVPHLDNLSYFGDGRHEAQLIYNFALPPLVLHTLLSGDAGALTRWAAGLALPSHEVTFFNFLASHDGIGINPARGILSQAEIDRLVDRVVAHGGLVSYKDNPDGSQSPYELNISYFDALSDPQAGEEQAIRVGRFLAAHAILLALQGVPGLYFHSLFGSRSWQAGVAQTGRKRTINRQKFSRLELEQALSQSGSLRQQVFSRLGRLLKVRSAHPAFHPQAAQAVLECNRAVFAVLRNAPETPDGPNEGETVLCLHNVSARPQTVSLERLAAQIAAQPGRLPLTVSLTDLISGQVVDPAAEQAIRLSPYQCLWLVPTTVVEKRSDA